MRRHLAAGFAAIILLPGLYMPAAAAPGEPIGATLSVINVVTAAFNRDTRTLQTGDDVRQNELIDVSKDASTELKLVDDTKLALGPGAKLKLDKFVYDADKSTGAIGVDLVEGAFRFMTGVAQKPSYVVKVPRASITVRGTIFDVFVQADETTWLLLHEGAVTVCNERGRCRDLDEPGKLLQITSNGDVGRPSTWAGLDRAGNTPFDDAFPFVVKPPTIDPKPALTRDEIIRLGSIEKDPKPRRRVDSNDDDPPVKKPKKPTKTAAPKEKKVRTTRNSKDDAAGKEALGLAIGIGVGIGLGKMGGGGRGKGMDGGGNRYKPR